MIDFGSKSRSSTQLNRWKSNRSEIDDRYRSPWNPNRRRFNSKPQIALAYVTDNALAQQLGGSLFESRHGRPII